MASFSGRFLAMLSLFLWACGPSTPATLLTVAFEVPAEDGFLAQITSYEVQVRYRGGEVNGRLFEYSFPPDSPGLKAGLFPTEEGESIELHVDALGLQEDGSSTLVARAESAPFAFSGQHTLTLLLGVPARFNVLTDPLKSPRAWHTVTRLPDGALLIAGGADEGGLALSSTAHFINGSLDQPLGVEVSTALITPRVHHSATLLGDNDTYAGQVLIAGGDSQTRLEFAYDETLGLTLPSVDLDISPVEPRDTLELYTPETDSTRLLLTLDHVLTLHQASGLLTGGVLLCGGLTEGTEEDTLQVSNLCTQIEDGTVVFSADMNDPRLFHQQTRLEDGRVLLTGGSPTADLSGVLLDSEHTLISRAELLETGAATTLDAGTMAVPRAGHSAVLLQDGRVLITGGLGMGVAWDGSRSLRLLASAERYFPPDQSSGGRPFQSISPMNQPRAFHHSVLLDDGTVLIFGGVGATLDTPLSPEIYDPELDTFVVLAGETGAGLGSDAAFLPNGQLLVAGGRWYPVDSEAKATPEEVGSTHTGFSSGRRSPWQAPISDRLRIYVGEGS